MGGRGSDKSERGVQKRARERTCVGLAVATRDITPGAMAALPRPQMIAAVILRPRPGPWSCGFAPASHGSRGGGLGIRSEILKNTHKSARRTFVRIAAALNSTAIRGSPIVSYPPLSLHLEQNGGGWLEHGQKCKRDGIARKARTYLPTIPT